MQSIDVVPTEHQEQTAFFAWWNMWAKGLPYLAFAVPNGGARNAVTGAMLKREGVMKGIPDIFIEWPRNGFHGLRIEMKRRKGGTVSKAQTAVMESLEQSGYRVVVARGWEEAKEAVEKYAGTQ